MQLQQCNWDGIESTCSHEAQDFQVDGVDDLPDVTEAVTQAVKLETKETQTDVFLKVDGWAEGCDEESFLDLLYDNPPPTVYHPE